MSLLMSAFALLILPRALASRASSAYRTLRYRAEIALGTRGFGVWFETRYIFGAGRLI